MASLKSWLSKSNNSAASRCVGYIRERAGYLLDGFYPGLNFLSFNKRFPSPAQSSIFAHNSTVIGDVQVGDSSAIWYNAVVRGDTGAVRIGSNTHIKPRAVVVGGHGEINRLSSSTHIGCYVVVEDSAVVQASVIEDYAYIGSGAVVSEGAYVEKKAYLAPLSVLMPGQRVPAGQYWSGNPAKYVRDLTSTEKELLFRSVTDISEDVHKSSDQLLLHDEDELTVRAAPALNEQSPQPPAAHGHGHH